MSCRDVVLFFAQTSVSFSHFSIPFVSTFRQTKRAEITQQTTSALPAYSNYTHISHMPQTETTAALQSMTQCSTLISIYYYICKQIGTLGIHLLLGCLDHWSGWLDRRGTTVNYELRFPFCLALHCSCLSINSAGMIILILSYIRCNFLELLKYFCSCKSKWLELKFWLLFQMYKKI